MKYKKGKIVKGRVTGIEDYGVFLSFDEYYTGLIHISEISHNYVNDITDYVKIGEDIYVEILDVDEEEFHLTLSIKNIQYKYNGKRISKKIKETEKGFTTLQKKLPLWIENKLKTIKKTENTIDK